MLVLTRKPKSKLFLHLPNSVDELLPLIGHIITIEFMEVKSDDSVRVGIDADRRIIILRDDAKTLRG